MCMCMCMHVHSVSGGVRTRPADLLHLSFAYSDSSSTSRMQEMQASSRAKLSLLQWPHRQSRLPLMSRALRRPVASACCRVEPCVSRLSFARSRYKGSLPPPPPPPPDDAPDLPCKARSNSSIWCSTVSEDERRWFGGHFSTSSCSRARLRPSSVAVSAPDEAEGAPEDRMMRPLATAAAKLVLCKSLAIRCFSSCFSAGNWRLQSMQHHLPVLPLNLTSGPSLSSKVCRASSIPRATPEH